MHNGSVQNIIKDCETELAKISQIIDALGQFNNTVPFLTKYAVIKACGSIEQCFKSIVSDHNQSAHSMQIRNFIDATIRNSSMNPSFKNIYSTLKKFDTNWHSSFKHDLKAHPRKSQLETSLNSLNEERNTFAHGGQPSASFASIQKYFDDSKEIILIIDRIVR